MTEDNVARLEAVEMAAWEDIFAAAPATMTQDLGIATRRFGPALATVARAIDNGQFCRVQGCGLPGDEAGASVDHAIEWFRGLGLKNFLIQIPPGAEADKLMIRCKDAGLVPFRRAWTKFRRGAEPAPAAPTRLNVLEATSPAQAKDFGDVAVAGFGMPPFLAPWLGALPGRPGWRCYVAYDGEAAVGVGAAFIQGNAAWLGVGATRPEARGQGSQSAILARRIADAVAGGVTLLCTETGSAVPGEPQTSFQNIQKAGFEIAYERLNFTEA